jgi:hypothetical protein
MPSGLGRSKFFRLRSTSPKGHRPAEVTTVRPVWHRRRARTHRTATRARTLVGGSLRWWRRCSSVRTASTTPMICALVRPALFGGVYDPSTSGEFLRSFSHGSVRQLQAGRLLLVPLAGGRAPLPDADGSRCGPVAAAGERQEEAGGRVRARQGRRLSAAACIGRPSGTRLLEGTFHVSRTECGPQLRYQSRTYALASPRGSARRFPKGRSTESKTKYPSAGGRAVRDPRPARAEDVRYAADRVRVRRSRNERY